VIDFSDLTIQKQRAILEKLIARLEMARLGSIADLAARQKCSVEEVWSETCVSVGIEPCTIPEGLLGIADECSFRMR
jgi:hypothetical protein